MIKNTFPLSDKKSHVLGCNKKAENITSVQRSDHSDCAGKKKCESWHFVRKIWNYQPHVLSGESASESHHSASLCSTSLRKPVWNLCSGSKVEKMLFCRESGVASSCATAFWNDWEHKQGFCLSVNTQNIPSSLYDVALRITCANIFK